ncbi:MAG UNVERIFIED_CONTAM: type-F conjugative transfer system secretin TraK [Rickettsiaceae bacterium]|jgi:hypothetical protein
MNRYLIGWAIGFVLFVGNAFGETIKANENERISYKISKSGLNRISNPPYQIVQVTGDEGSYKLKYDEDGQNIYIMPLKKIGEKIEISIKNNRGSVQDLELEVTNIPGQTLNIDSGISVLESGKHLNKTLSVILKAMKHNRHDKFYVQDVDNMLQPINGLSVTQIKSYQWQNLKGGVFIVKNNTKKEQFFDLKQLANRFDNVKVAFVDKPFISPKAKRKVFIIQSQEL